MKNSRKGFTLIELLVVISIIGILSSIVLVSLSSARNKGKDASAKGSMSSMRAQAEMGYSTNYLADLCTTSGTTLGGLATLKTAVDSQVPAANASLCIQNAAAGNAPSGWAAVVTLNDGAFFCVDSSGYSGSVVARSVIGATSGVGADVSCN